MNSRNCERQQHQTRNKREMLQRASGKDAKTEHSGEGLFPYSTNLLITVQYMSQKWNDNQQFKLTSL